MEIASSKFEGKWELLEWTAESKDGKVTYPFGVNAIGQISYDSDGNMAVQIMKNDRIRFINEDPLQAQPNEIIAAYDGFMAYYGEYQINADAHQVIHKVKVSSFPNWVGREQIRNYAFEEDKLILSTSFIGSRRHKLIWEKLK